MASERFFDVKIRYEVQNDGPMALRKGSDPIIGYHDPEEVAYKHGAGYSRIRKLLEAAIQKLDDEERRRKELYG